MAHDVLIAIHALAGVACFAAGAASLGLSTATSWRFRTYLVSLGAMLVFLAAAIALDWPDLDTGTRVLFLALVALGLYMGWRATQAATRLRSHGPDWRSRYADDIGFTLISLFDGFVIIAALDLGAPGWLVGLVAVAGVVGGILTMNQVKARLRTQPTAP